MGEAEQEGLDGVDLVVLAVALAGGLYRGRRGRLVELDVLDARRLAAAGGEVQLEAGRSADGGGHGERTSFNGE